MGICEIHERIHRDSQDFGRGFREDLSGFETLGEDLLGFVRIHKTLGEDLW